MLRIETKVEALEPDDASKPHRRHAAKVGLHLEAAIGDGKIQRQYYHAWVGAAKDGAGFVILDGQGDFRKDKKKSCNVFGLHIRLPNFVFLTGEGQGCLGQFNGSRFQTLSVVATMETYLCSGLTSTSVSSRVSQ